MFTKTINPEDWLATLRESGCKVTEAQAMLVRIFRPQRILTQRRASLGSRPPIAPGDWQGNGLPHRGEAGRPGIAAAGAWLQGVQPLYARPAEGNHAVHLPPVSSSGVSGSSAV